MSDIIKIVVGFFHCFKIITQRRVPSRVAYPNDEVFQGPVASNVAAAECGYGVESLRHAPPQQFTGFPGLSVLQGCVGIVKVLPGMSYVPSDFIKQSMVDGITVSGGQLLDPSPSGTWPSADSM